MRHVMMTLVAAGLLAGCSKDWKVERVDPGSVADLDYRFDEAGFFDDPGRRAGIGPGLPHAACPASAPPWAAAVRA